MRTRFSRRRSTPAVDPSPAVVPVAGVAGPPPASTCRAPSAAMQFGVVGVVNACCMNGQFNYGDVRTQTVREIWDGAPRRVMVGALADGVYPPGCEGCGAEHAVGNRQTTPAQSFDRFPDGPHEWPLQMEFTLSNRCNLECVQCNGLNSSRIRARREHLPPLDSPYGEEFFAQLEPFLEHLQVAAFLGGEPFLAPEARRIWDMLIERDLHPEVQVTTNATIWNERVQHYAHALRMAFAVSIDGATAATYESIRVGATYDRVVANRDRMIEACAGYGSRFHLNYCLMVQNWFEVGQFLRQADDLGVSANVIPVYGPEPNSLFHLSQREVTAVVERLEEEGSGLRPELGLNRPAWDMTVAMLRSHADRLGSERSADRLRQAVRAEQRSRLGRDAPLGDREVSVGLPGPSGGRAARRVEEAAELLRSWADGEPVVAVTSGVVVVDVEVPRDVPALGAEAWIGHHVIPVAEGEHLPGGAGRLVARWDPEERTSAFEVWFDSPDGPLEVRSVLLDGADRLLVAVRAAGELVGLGDARTRRALAELRSWSGRDPGEVAVLDGAVASVDVPGWAEPFGLGERIGRDVGRLADDLGFGHTTFVDTPAPGLAVIEAAGSTHEGPSRCRIVDVRAAGRWFFVARPLATLDSEAARDAIDGLHRWSGRQPIEITTRGPVVAAVDAPAWAAELGLDPTGWVDAELLALGSSIAAELGPVTVGEDVEVAPGVILSALTADAPSGPVLFRTLYLEAADRLLLAVADPDGDRS